MNGVLQSADAQPKSNPMLDQIIQHAEAQVPENLKSQFLSVMTVGGKLMWSDQMTQTRAQFDQLVQQYKDNIPTLVTHTVLREISVIQNESKQKDPLPAVGLAAPIFMAYILQYVESKHGIPVTKDMIDQTGQLLQVNLLKMYGVKYEHIQELIQMRSGQGGQQPPAQSDQSDQSAAQAQGDQSALSDQSAQGPDQPQAA